VRRSFHEQHVDDVDRGHPALGGDALYRLGQLRDRPCSDVHRAVGDGGIAARTLPGFSLVIPPVAGSFFGVMDGRASE